MKVYKATIIRCDNYVTAFHLDDDPEYFDSYDKAKLYIEKALVGADFNWNAGTAKIQVKSTQVYYKQYDISIEGIEVK